MVELTVLNSELETCGTFDDFTTLIWIRKYYETGSFELHCDPAYFQLLAQGKYLYSPDFVETGIIQYLKVDNAQNKLVVKGKFLEELLSDRIITEIVDGLNTPEIWARQWVDRYAINPSQTARKIHGLNLGDLHNIGTKIRIQTRGDQLLEGIRNLATPQECGVRILYNYESNAMLFEVWQGLDRTETQSANSFAVFSDEEDTADIEYYLLDMASHKNYAYVAGEGEGLDRIIVEIDDSGGLARKEIWVDAKDLQRGDLNTEQYNELLVQRGVEKLAEYQITEGIKINSISTSALVYREDYDLGDKCTVRAEKLGVAYSARIEEITEEIEGGARRVIPILGAPPSTLLKELRRR